MLAQRISKIVTWSLLTLLIVATADSSLAQDQQNYVRPPSQRYQPAEAQAAPPSVHVAPGDTQRLQRTLSDESLPNWNTQQQGTIAQTSYQEPTA